VHDLPQFTVPEEVVIDSQPDSLAATVQVINSHVEDVATRCMTTSAQCISTLLLSGTSSRSLIAKLFIAP